MIDFKGNQSLAGPRVTGRVSPKPNSDKRERGTFASPSLRENPLFGRLAHLYMVGVGKGKG